MTESSMVWGGTAIGDAAAGNFTAPYSDDEFSDMLAMLLTYDRTTQGVIRSARTGYSGNLAVTNPAGTTIRVATGIALVDGKLYTNSANVDNSVVAPGGGSNFYRIVLRKDFAAQTVRVALIGPNIAAFPAVTQTDGTTWEISLAGIEITAASAVTVTDERNYSGGGGVWIRMDNDAIQADSGGDARGDYAIDAQQVRAAATQVASGDYSFVAGGRNNTASGNYSHAEGISTEATGLYSHAEGNDAIASGQSSHAEGEDTLASGLYSHAEGTDTIAAGGSSHAEGEGTVAEGTYAHAEGYNTTAGILVGMISPSAPHAEGIYSVAQRDAQHAFASGRFAADGDAQGSRFHLLEDITHSDANWHSLLINGFVANDMQRMIIPVDTTWAVDVLIVGTTAGTGAARKGWGYKIVGVIENDGGTVAIKAQALTVLYEADDTDFSAQIAADAATDSLLVQVSDSTSGGDVVRWSAVVNTAEVTFPA